MNRRALLKRSSLIALAPTVPGFLARLARATEAKRDDRILVVIQLSGGNDGINTVVPYRDEGYAKHRRQLRLPQDQLHKLNADFALHPSMRKMADLFAAGHLAVVQGVGYPNPNRSHDVSMAIWHTARFDRTEHKSYGWLGRALDQATMDAAPSSAMFVGDGVLPGALVGRKSIAGTFNRLDELALQNEAVRAILPLPPGEGRGEGAQSQKRFGDDGILRDRATRPHPNPLPEGEGTKRRRPNSLPDGDKTLAAFVERATLDSYTTSAAVRAAAARQQSQTKYPQNQLAEHLRMIAQLIEADLPARVYYAAQDNYDTHAVQLPTQARLLGELSGALAAFLDDLKQAGLAERVLVMTFSEFGRRVAENASAGTDHGTAAPMFLAGPVRGGLIGDAPRLLDLVDGDLKMTTDFRRVYATVLADWLAIDPAAVLAGDFAKLPLV